MKRTNPQSMRGKWLCGGTLLVLGLLVACGTGALGYPAGTTTAILGTTATTAVVGEGVFVEFQVTVPDCETNNPDDYTVKGTITVEDDTGVSCSRTWDGTGYECGWLWDCTLYPTTAGTRTLTATFVPLEPAYFNGSTSAGWTLEVSKADTTTSVSTSGTPSLFGEPVTFTALVSVDDPGGGAPTGAVTFKDGGAAIGTGALSAGTSIFTTSTLDVGTHTITAEYGGDVNYNGSTSAPVTQVVVERDTETTVFCSDTALVVNDTVTCLCTVSDISPGISSVPTGDVDVSVDPTGEGSPTTWSHLLIAADGGQFTFTYTPDSAETTPHVFSAEYDGSTVHAASTSYNVDPDLNHDFDQEIIKRAVDIEMSVVPTFVYILQPLTISVHVEDDTTAGAPASFDGVEITFDNDGKNGTFTGGVTQTLDPNGDCTVTYTPAAGDTDPDLTAPWDPDPQAITTITATLDETFVYAEKSIVQPVTVSLRPTVAHVAFPTSDTIVVNQLTTFKVSIEDVAGVPMATPTYPQGTITITNSLPLSPDPGDITVGAPSGPVDGTNPETGNYWSQWSYTYKCTGLDNDADVDTVAGFYESDDGIYANSFEGYTQGIYRRETETVLTPDATADATAMATATGYEYTVTVTDVEATGTQSVPSGYIGDMSDCPPCDPPDPLAGCTLTDSPPDQAYCGPNAVTTDEAFTFLAVRYVPDDRVHLPSGASANIDRSSDATNLPEGTPPSGTWIIPPLWIDGITLGLNTACLAANVAILVIEGIQLAVDPTPDPIVGAGCVAITGSTIPTSDIASTIAGIAKIGLGAFTLGACTDLDGDGLYTAVEVVTLTLDALTDTDFDGMTDSDEISNAGGLFGGIDSNGRPACPCPSPLFSLAGLVTGYSSSDSDGDGLKDGAEETLHQTRYCDPDTDDDNLNDGVEVATLSGPVEDQCDPLLPDTDGDGIQDDIEYASTSCTYSNDDDSDDDGLDDGTEDWNADGSYTASLAGTGDQASTSWETNPCDVDTDGDGLSDGEEFQLLGGLKQDPDAWKGSDPAVTPFVGVSVVSETHGGTTTIPALDTDSDDDGLTDYDEINTYQTDPLDWDTDDDTLSDKVEVESWLLPDTRNHANPREADTDGDGLRDDFEITPGCNCDGTGTDGYVNDDDSDDDGLQDGREFELFGTGADLETAGTGATAANDGELGTDTVCCLCDPDSDDDGLSDGEEDHVGTNPVDWDSDNDGLSDREELQIYFTDPKDDDTDGDEASGILPKRPTAIGLPTTGTAEGYNGSTSTGTYDSTTFDVYDILLGSDGEEALSRTGVYPFGFLGDQSDPLSKDTDGDAIQDDIEFPPGCNCSGEPGSSEDGFVNDSDSDDDGIQDGSDTSPDVAASNGNDGELNDDPICSLCDPDSDGDGLSDGEEIHIGTEPLDWDSDDDGLSDYEELQIYFTDPNDDDTDDDQADGNVAARNPATAPVLTGHSGDGTIAALSDCEEALSGTSHPPFGNGLDETDPLQLDTDGDGLGDEVEFKVECSCETNEWADCPNGTWEYADPNFYGVVYDPMRDGYANSFDSDGDGLRDDLDIAEDVAESDGNDGELNDDSTHSICDPDSDGDGLLDGEEYQTGTDWLDWDFDDDGLSDREELQTYFTDPNDDDTDDDKAEGNMGARDPTIAPTLPGHSGSGTIAALSDCEEAFSGTSYPPFGNPFDETDPLQLDTDGDGLGDEIEFKVGCSCATTDWSDCPNGAWGYASPNHYGVVYDPFRDGYANSFDSDDDGLRDDDDIHEDLVEAGVAFPGKVFTILGEYCVDLRLREQRDDDIHSICDPDSDGDGLLDGEEFAIGTDWLDWDTDDDGRNDWHEHTGGEQVVSTDPIPTDPFDPDTDDDGLLDSAEVFGLNNTNPLNADTDGDGLCDGGTGTPYMISGDPTVNVNPICKSCAEPGLDPCAVSIREGSVDGIGDHPNPHGYGEDKNGNGAWDSGPSYWAGDETDPNQYDTDGDAEGDGIEVLGFSTSRQGWIPTVDLFGRPINVTYPECGCLDPLDPDTDDDQLEDGYEDNNHDGNFDFLPSDFDYEQVPLPGPPQPNPNETNPCDHDTDDDELDDYEERYQSQVFVLYSDQSFPFNPTNPLDHDTDNDWLLDGEEVFWECVALAYWTLDNDTDGLTDEDPIDGIDNDGDGLIDEDPQDYWIRFVPMLDPTNRDSDSDGFIDGLDDDPCNSELIPLLAPVQAEPIDTDGDGFSDDDELLAGTHPNDPEDHPVAFGMMNLDLDECFDDRMWLEPSVCCGIANSVVIDIDSDILADIRVQIVQPRDVRVGDFDGDGYEDDARYVIEYAFALYRVVQRRIVVTIDDFDMDLVIDAVSLEQK